MRGAPVNSSRALIIVNPIAGGGRARRIQPAIADYFREQHWPAEFTVSASTEDLRRIAAEAIAAGYRCVAALGGDGAFHHLAEAAVGSPTILGFLPAGNGNDIAAGLGLPRDPIEAARVLVYGKPRAIDVVRFRSLEIESMQGGDARVQRSREAIFVGAGGAGLDAEAAQLANTRFKRWPGVTRYIAGALWAWRDFRAFDLAASIDGVPWRGRALFAAIANGPCYGSGVRIAPAAQMDDGWLNITMVREMPLARLLEAIPIVLRTGDIRWPEIERFRCRRFSLRASTRAQVHGDGELLGALPAEFEIIPGAIRVMA
jgi:diacylglycerol kinase (ATP)